MSGDGTLSSPEVVHLFYSQRTCVKATVRLVDFSTKEDISELRKLRQEADRVTDAFKPYVVRGEGGGPADVRFSLTKEAKTVSPRASKPSIEHVNV